MKFAYADPPYLGLGKTKYGHLHPNASDYDTIEAHAQLIDRLNADYDGWAYSLHTPALRLILPLCPPDIRVLAWVKPFASWKPGVNPTFAWEPVIAKPLPRKHDKSKRTTRDWVAVNITLKRGLTGAKPEGFSKWLFSACRLEAEDEFFDLFPGTGGVQRAWEEWRAEQQPVETEVAA